MIDRPLAPAYFYIIKVPEFLSTHPSDETRIKKLSVLIPEIKEKYYKP